MDLNATMFINGGIGICLRALEAFPQPSTPLGRSTSIGRNGYFNRPSTSNGVISERPPLSTSDLSTNATSHSNPALSLSDGNRTARDRSGSSETLMESNLISNSGTHSASNNVAAGVRRSSSISRSKASTPPPPPPPRASSGSNLLSGISFLIQCSGSLETSRVEIEKRLNVSNGNGKEKKWENARLLGGVETKVSKEVGLEQSDR